MATPSNSPYASEVWKPIRGFENRYLISNSGRVRSLRTNCILVGSTSTGRRVVSLYKDGSRSAYYVYHLVAQAFLSPPLGQVGKGIDDWQINHIDGDPLNDGVWNLEWVPRTENEDHAVSHGLKRHGSSHVEAKLTEEDVRAIRRRHANGEQQKTLCKEYGVSAPTMSQVVNRKTWKHVE